MVVRGALEAGAPAQAPFDAILLEGAVPAGPRRSCSISSRMADGWSPIVADGAFGRAQVWRRTGKVFDARSAFDAGAEPLPGFARNAEFSL